MKKTINGKTYNTEKAKELASWGNGGRPRDFDAYSETLYQMKDGSLFIYGVGGPDSKYAKPVAGVWSGGKDITPVSKSEAIQLIKENANRSEQESIIEGLTV